MSELTERIPQHKHCIMCGKAFVDGIGRYCSMDCKEKKKTELTKTKRKLMIVWVVAAGLMVLAIVISMMTK